MDVVKSACLPWPSMDQMEMIELSELPCRASFSGSEIVEAAPVVDSAFGLSWKPIIKIKIILIHGVDKP